MPSRIQLSNPATYVAKWLRSGVICDTMPAIGGIGVDIPRITLMVVFLLGSIPLVWQDLRSLSVSQVALVLVVGLWVTFSLWLGVPWSSASLLSSGVLIVGMFIDFLLPDSLGEGDILYMAGLAWLLPFWPFLVAMATACILGLLSWVWRSRTSQAAASAPMAFLPLLALGGLSVMGATL